MVYELAKHHENKKLTIITKNENHEFRKKKQQNGQ
ncbi:hypothetical protein SAMN05421636_102278 [Pricia antarctica]|uniref:Uncharacterized protein n=1 Tax=Pricia antarctica TaxID=641691 RepID=A0A1G6YJ80_9FLAO|nr:hypothetical protein SAMN05421636_102278 [Pricia antarctica]